MPICISTPARGRSRTERTGCSAHAGVQRLSFREQFHFLAIRDCPNETASGFDAWLARADDPARRCLPCRPGNEYWKLFQTGVDLSTNMFSTTFFTLTGFHGLHVLIGLIALLIFLWLAWEGDFASAAANPPLSESATTGTLSMSSGSLFYSLFTSFHFSDDYLPVFHYRLDMEFDSSTS